MMTMASNAPDNAEVRSLLDRLIRQSGESYAAISRRIGRNAAYVQQFIRRGTPRRLSELDRQRLALHFGISERALGAPDPAIRPDSARISIGDEACVLVPCIITRESTAIALNPALASSISGGNSEHLAGLMAEGDSMAPTIMPGNFMLFDMSVRHARCDGLYLLAGGARPFVRRLMLHPVSGRISIHADNPAYPAWADCEPSGVPVIGRLLWLAKAIG